MDIKTMIRTVKDKKNPYVMINKQLLNDKKLSLKAKGLLCFLLAKPDDWQVYISNLANDLKESRETIGKIMKELIDNNYCFRQKIRNEKGQLKGYEYQVHEVKKPKTEKPSTVKPTPEKSTLLYNEKQLCNERELNNISGFQKKPLSDNSKNKEKEAHKEVKDNKNTDSEGSFNAFFLSEWKKRYKGNYTRIKVIAENTQIKTIKEVSKKEVCCSLDAFFQSKDEWLIKNKTILWFMCNWDNKELFAARQNKDKPQEPEWNEEEHNKRMLEKWKTEAC